MRVRMIVGGLACAVMLTSAVGMATGSRSQGPFGPPEIACAFDSSAHLLRIEYGIPGGDPRVRPIVWITRAGDTIRIEENFPGIGPRAQCVGGDPTVLNTERIELAVAAPIGGSETYILPGPDGLGPGATAEPGGDEIEIETELGPTASVHVTTTATPDSFAFGSRRGLSLVNLNAGERRPDADLTATEGTRLSVNLAGGRNRATAMGGAGTGGPFDDRVLMIGGTGPDRLVGGRGNDDLSAYEGNDVLIGGPGDDRLDLVGGRGRDRLICGPGHDHYRSSGKDRVRCRGDRGRGAGSSR
jgi:hypothetical protein